MRKLLLAAIVALASIASVHAEDLGNGGWVILGVSKGQAKSGIADAFVTEAIYPSMMDCAPVMLAMYGKMGGAKSSVLMYCAFVPGVTPNVK